VVAEPPRMKIPKELPVLPVKGGVVFPHLVVPLILTHKRSLDLIDDALSLDRIIATVAQRDQKEEEPGPDDIYRYGTASVVLRMFRSGKSSMRVMVQGLQRIKILHFLQRDPYMIAIVEELPEKEIELNKEVEALKHNILSMFKEVVENSPYLSEDLLTVALNFKDPGKLADFIASYMNFPVEEKEKLLETLDPIGRLRVLLPSLSRELEVVRLSRKIEEEVKNEIDRGQREFLLREQLKAIQRELGIKDDVQVELENLRKKVESLNLPKEAREVALNELEKVSRMLPGSPEYTVSRNYLDWILSLPWSSETDDNLDLLRVRKILDEDHYDLEQVKERILEFLAVRKLKKDSKGPILCFVGPPGVGKTSLGRSIARALGRKFVRVSLGGIRDEAEIRGHRRTYVGALPGRIIQGIRHAGSRNPVFMLDEVDKIGADFKGDPASALLEVLDQEQNSAFSDHYIEIPFDLSHVLFITTANITATIPPPLLDRMEVISIPGYVDDDKVRIAEGFIIPKQIKENGLEGIKVLFGKRSILTLIREYTEEAGVRELERKIGSILRKIAKEIAMGASIPNPYKITKEKIVSFLGPPEVTITTKEKILEPGIAIALAWTPVGGEILFVEALKMLGGGRLYLTGHLGDVMRESAEAALSLVRAKSPRLGIKEDFFKSYDVHIHVPQGSIPKDGPSAGLAIFVALTSLFTEKRVSSDVAMTGEITLRGRVIRVGGIKEKVIAAYRGQIKRVILPEENERDLRDVPDKIKEKLEIKLVNHIDEVISLVFHESAHVYSR